MVLQSDDLTETDRSCQIAVPKEDIMGKPMLRKTKKYALFKCAIDFAADAGISPYALAGLPIQGGSCFAVNSE